MTERQRGRELDGSRPAVDSKCFDLAAAFLDDMEGATEDDIWELARDLQRDCEDVCAEVEDRRERG